MKKLIACFMAVFGALIMSPSLAKLIDLPGKYYNYDTETGLSWLDVSLTSHLSYNQLTQGTNNTWYAEGWRLATGAELSALFASNLPTLLTASPPFSYGSAPSDFYAATQFDSNKTVAKLIVILGGSTMKFGNEAYGIVSLIDREVECFGGCTAHALSTLGAYYDGRSEVNIAGGMMDTVAYPQYGRYLVSSTMNPAPIPEPENYILTLCGVGICLTRRAMKKT